MPRITSFIARELRYVLPAVTCLLVPAACDDSEDDGSGSHEAPAEGSAGSGGSAGRGGRGAPSGGSGRGGAGGKTSGGAAAGEDGAAGVAGGAAGRAASGGRGGSGGRAPAAGRGSPAAGSGGAAEGGDAGVEEDAGGEAAGGAGGEAAGGAGGEAAGGAGGEAGSGEPGAGTYKVYVGGNGTAVSVLSLDAATATLTQDAQVNGGAAPSYLAASPDQRFLYAVDENAGGDSSVIAYAIDPSSGGLSELNRTSSGGQGGLHLAVHPSGRWLAVTHYTTHQTTILPVLPNGSVGAVTQSDTGPSGSCTNAHQAVFDRSGNHLFVPCLWSDYVIQYNFDSAAGTLALNTPDSAPVGSPRHLAFDPEERFAYVLSERSSTITWFKYDAASGTLSEPQQINSYQNTVGGSAHIAVHPTGRWLYASNRAENSLGLFALDAAGAPQAVAFETAGLGNPRDFSLDPSGSFLLLSNQDGDQDVVAYRIAEADGRLTRAGSLAVGGNPTCTLTLVLP
ncbi:MAG: lactonase family protein [Polyangiales bacterium]